MAIQGQINPAYGKEVSRKEGEPHSLAISESGIRTGADFAHLMSALMSDLISGRIAPDVGNAACNAGGKLLKVVEMQYKFGTQSGTQGDRTLQLAPNLPKSE